ncbi:hypothetical protein ACLMJK_006377 [Lecanora helva]
MAHPVSIDSSASSLSSPPLSPPPRPQDALGEDPDLQNDCHSTDSTDGIQSGSIGKQPFLRPKGTNGKPANTAESPSKDPSAQPNSKDMASRNRPRGFAKEDASDAHEERNMWNQIVTDVKRLKTIHARAAEVAKLQVEMEANMGKKPTVAQIDELMALYREGVKLAEEEEKILKEEPNDVIKNIEILAALRSASETEPARPAHTQPKPRNPKRQQKPETDGAADSPVAPVMSPSVVLPAARIKGTSTGPARSGSVPATREVTKEPVVKVEEGLEGSKGPAGEKAGKFFIGAEVAYRQAKPREDGSQWIQCIIQNITEVGGKKRYEVQDPEPDENGQPGQVYKTTANALIAIPREGDPLVDFPVGKQVLARYPETTTFYRAFIAGGKKEVYRLKFEDDQGQEMEVGRRFVLDVSAK